MTGWAAQVRAAQALAYDAVEAVAATLHEGQTERDAAAAIETWLRARGVREWFHRPFAWFGERTAFVGAPLPGLAAVRSPWTPLHFFPTNRRLREGMPVILDVAPVLEGAAADVGYACWFGREPDPRHDRLLADLEPYRALVLDGVRAGDTLRTIYRRVDRLATEQGHRNRHRAYPFGVIAHRLEDGPTRVPLRALEGRRAGGFGFGAQRFLAGEAAASLRGGDSPLWNGTRWSDHPATPGLWAVEPHLSSGRGADAIGVKWEEVLVVTADGADWLDDDLPHVRRWSGR